MSKLKLMLKKKLAVFLSTALSTALFTTLSAVASLPAHAGDKPEARPLRIGWVYAMANAPALIADKKGFYAAEGLKVDLKPFGDGPVLQQAVAAGELDIAYVGAPPVYQWFSRGLVSKIIAKVNYGQAAVIAGKDKSIQTVADLRGKKLAGVAKGSGMDVLLRGYVLKDNARLEPDRDVSIVAMPPANMNAALDRDMASAAFTWEPFISQAVLNGSGRVILDLNQALPNYPWYVIMALPKTLQERPGDVAKLLRAHRKAIAFLKEHPDEADRLIADAFQLEAIHSADGKTIEPVAIVKEARKRLGWSDRLEPSDLQFIQRLMDYSLALGFIDKPLKVEQVVDTAYQLPPVQDRQDKQGKQ
jgi:NitT/TauT family transport system substrate-binding protein